MASSLWEERLGTMRQRILEAMNVKQKIRKYLPHEMGRVEHLFAAWEETVIWSCLQGIMGSVYAPDAACPQSAAAQLNDFCFLAGKPCAELVDFFTGQNLILTPQNEEWAALIESVCAGRVKRQMRYAIKKDPNCFDAAKLEALAHSLPEKYSCMQIERGLYDQCLASKWSRDLVSSFPTYEEFERLGLGFVITANGKIVAGASSYSRYSGGIEIEIVTRMEYRRQGLAAAVGAALILECLRRGWYPSWDAYSKTSVALAEKLGYAFSHEYPVYYEI